MKSTDNKPRVITSVVAALSERIVFMEIFNITGESYNDEVENYNGTVLIDFFAEWCKPCKMLSPVIEDIAVNSAGDVKVCKVNVDSEKALAQKFGIMSIPTVVVVKNGEIKNRSIGVTGKSAIMDMLK